MRNIKIFSLLFICIFFPSCTYFYDKKTNQNTVYEVFPCTADGFYFDVNKGYDYLELDSLHSFYDRNLLNKILASKTFHPKDTSIFYFAVLVFFNNETDKLEYVIGLIDDYSFIIIEGKYFQQLPRCRLKFKNYNDSDDFKNYTIKRNKKLFTEIAYKLYNEQSLYLGKDSWFNRFYPEILPKENKTKD